MIGHSLSHCVEDILNGNMAEEDVTKIVARTAMETGKQIDGVLADYRWDYWSKDPDEGEAIARRLLAAGKVEQPRLLGSHRRGLSRNPLWTPDEEVTETPKDEEEVTA